MGVFGAIVYKVLGYVQGPKLTAAKTAELLKQEAMLLADESKLISLKLERINNTRIAVAKLSDLSEDRGQLCTDFFLQPAMVLKTGDETCIARSAVCTHLGCTVKTELVDGKIFCPCHVSYFDVATGKPLAGPASYPLAEEPLVIEGDLVYLVKPTGPIKIGPTQMPAQPL